jgi:hypothetical protein
MDLRVHLKVCEGCGCLWYRLQDEIRVYCTTCHERFKEFPTPQSRKRRGRPKKTTLPTVFAVEAHSEPEWKDISPSRKYGLELVHHRNNYNRSSIPLVSEEPSLAFIASEAAALSTRAAILGGAQ